MRRGFDAVETAATSDYAAQLIARSLQDIAAALVEPEEAQQHIVPPRAGVVAVMRLTAVSVRVAVKGR
jgi:hypothetical protein